MPFGMRENFTSMHIESVHASLRAERIDVGNLILRTQQNVAALDAYLAGVDRASLVPAVARGRLLRVLTMGSLPFVGMIAAFGMLATEAVTSENARLLSGFILIGCALLTAIAVISAAYVVMESASHNWIIARNEREVTMEFVAATMDLLGSNHDVGIATIQHFERYGKISPLFSGYGSRMSA